MGARSTHDEELARKRSQSITPYYEPYYEYVSKRSQGSDLDSGGDDFQNPRPVSSLRLESHAAAECEMPVNLQSFLFPNIAVDVFCPRS